MSNEHVHPIFKHLLDNFESAMSKPKTQTEIDQWNEGARQADAHWADDPHERTAGIEYERVRIGGKNVNGITYPVYEQIETKRQR